MYDAHIRMEELLEKRVNKFIKQHEKENGYRLSFTKAVNVLLKSALDNVEKAEGKGK